MNVRIANPRFIKKKTNSMFVNNAGTRFPYRRSKPFLPMNYLLKKRKNDLFIIN